VHVNDVAPPLLTEDGKLVLESHAKLARGPAGSGGFGSGSGIGSRGCPPPPQALVAPCSLGTSVLVGTTVGWGPVLSSRGR
jgi:hypothetical protein